ncbi:hypothetical protein GCM10020295_83400 [Streptomyces cinereospinus]
MQHDGHHAGHLPSGTAHPHPRGDRLRAGQIGLEVGEVADQILKEPGRRLAVVAVAVRLGGRFQVGQIGRGAVRDERHVHRTAGVGQGGERRSGETGGEPAAQQLAAVHGVVSIVGLREGRRGAVLPGSRSKAEKGTGNPKCVRNALDRVKGGHRRLAPRNLGDPLGPHAARLTDPVIAHPCPVSHGEHGREITVTEGPSEHRIAQQTVRNLGWRRR